MSSGVTLMYNLTCLIFFPPSSQFRRELGVSDSQPSGKVLNSLASGDALLFHIALVTMSHSPQPRQAWQHASVVPV